MDTESSFSFINFCLIANTFCLILILAERTVPELSIKLKLFKPNLG